MIKDAWLYVCHINMSLLRRGALFIIVIIWGIFYFPILWGIFYIFPIIEHTNTDLARLKANALYFYTDFDKR